MTRVTQGMLTSNYLMNENRNLTNMQKVQSQLASKKEISRASDNPYKVSRIMQLYNEIDANKQFNENIKDTTSWLDATDTALSQINNVFARIRELQVSAGNGSYNDDERLSIQKEVKQKTIEIAQILNNNFDGAFIFGGTKSTSKPVMVDASGNIQYADKNSNSISIYKDVSVTPNVFTMSSTPSTASAVIDLTTNPSGLSAVQEINLETKLKNGATSETRKEEIKMIIGTRETVYTKTYNNALTSDTSGTAIVIPNTGLTLNQKEMLQAELNDVSTNATRKTDIQNLLNKDYSSGTVTIYQKDSISYAPTVTNPSSFCIVTTATSTDVNNAKASLKAELSSIDLPTEKRKGEIERVLETITPKVDTVYLRPDGVITTSNQNEPVILSDVDVNNLEIEYKNVATISTRKAEIANMLVVYNQINSDLKVEVSQGVMMGYNSTAFGILSYKDANGNVKSISDLLNKIANNLNPKNTTITNADGTKSLVDPYKVSGVLLTEMDSAIKNLLSERSRIGALNNRMESSQMRNDADNESMTEILSKTEDVDFAEKTMEYSELQTVYMASLQVSGKILPMTLLNYL